MTVKYIIKCLKQNSDELTYLKHMKIYKEIPKSWFYCTEKQPQYAHKFDTEEYCQKIVDKLNQIEGEIHTYSVIPYLAVRKLQSINS